LTQLDPPDDEHLLLETCRGTNKYIKKECIKLVTTQKFQHINVRGAQSFLTVSYDTSITFVPSFVIIGEMVQFSEVRTQISTVISQARLFLFKEEEKQAKIGLVSFVYALPNSKRQFWREAGGYV
jgi:hypothetical protein